jgi:hypothetical protein
MSEPDPPVPISLPELYDEMIEYLADTEPYDVEAGLADIHRRIKEDGE